MGEGLGDDGGMETMEMEADGKEIIKHFSHFQ